MVIHMSDPVGGRVRYTQATPAGLHRLFRDGIERPADVPAGEEERGVCEASVPPAVYVYSQRRICATSFAESMLTGGEDLVNFPKPNDFPDYDPDPELSQDL